MRNAIARVTVAIGALFAAACGGKSGSIPSSGVSGPTFATRAGEIAPVSTLTGGLPVLPQPQETVLYSFAYGSGGSQPGAGLTDVNGVLYGTTPVGGDHGTVFQITTSGAERVLYHFKGGSDGSVPISGLTNVNGVLYGTTISGGDSNGDGTVFQITTSGAESVLYRFKGGSDGTSPRAGLTNVNGVLYGTTAFGGAGSCSKDGCGTAFKLTTSGTETILYRFQGGSDGSYPYNYDGLTNIDGVLYGSTFSGGDTNNDGTVFKITTNGTESVLHRFGAGTDGARPYGLTDVNGVLYGTTEVGGALTTKGFLVADGTVFKITTSGAETVLHSFGGGSDGRNPYAGLINVNGVLYGTTSAGGASRYGGTVFKITTAGVKTTLYRFLGGSDGSQPQADLTYLNGVLYGTTQYGGASGVGTVFALSL